MTSCVLVSIYYTQIAMAGLLMRNRLGILSSLPPRTSPLLLPIPHRLLICVLHNVSYLVLATLLYFFFPISRATLLIVLCNIKEVYSYANLLCVLACNFLVFCNIKEVHPYANLFCAHSQGREGDHTMDFQDWDAYSTKKPLLDTIRAAPPHGVYGSLYEANRPFVCKDDGRIALLSGALTIRSSRIPRDQPLH
jgi:energy-converting hydrogenase Eha subunit C